MVEINSYINGKVVPYDVIQQWEEQRLARVDDFFVHHLLHRHGYDAAAHTLDEQRQTLAELKFKLGDDKVRKVLGFYLGLSQVLLIIVSFLSFGRRKFSAVEITISGGKGGVDMDPATFLGRLERIFTDAREEYKMMVFKACPDHYLIGMTDANTMEIIETTGGSPFPAQFFFCPGNDEGLLSRKDPTYDVQMFGAVKTKNGTIFGGIRHQIRKESDGGLRVKLLIEFPGLAPDYLIRQHQKHLLCEFNSWVSDVLAMRE
ncbi:hypothetical protein BGZ83_003048 [Gryganskiella cystojenkinii]|nr:hypothetical protein BGZ83_003048 [Gryganskiella cystojenkinii]